MNVARGDIVLADLVFSDRAGTKKRPSLVVSTDRNNAVIDDIILAAISSFTRQGALTHVPVDPATSEGKSSGLLHASYVQRENLFTLDKRFLIRPLGNLAATLQGQVNDCLMASLELP